MRYKGYGLATEILFKCGLNNLRLYEIPMTANAREYGTSYVKVIRVFKSIFFCMLFYTFRKYNLDFNKFFLKIIADKIYYKMKHTKLFC